MKKLFFVFFFCICHQIIFAQILQDVEYKNKIVQALHKMYNFEFAETDKYINQIKEKYPNSPCAYTISYMKLYLQYAPLSQHPQIQKVYLANVNKALELAEKTLNTNPNDVECTFFAMSALGNLTAWQADSDQMMKAVNTARLAFPLVKKGMKMIEVQNDFLFTTGLYNYYIEQYPEDHPIVKPFMVFFGDGNKKLGLSQLDKSYRQSLFTGVESAYYCIYIYLKHENRPDKALTYVLNLLEKYPKNIMLLSRKAEAQLALGQTNEIAEIVAKLNQTGGGIYPIMADYFEGKAAMLKNNDATAEKKFLEVIKSKMEIKYTKQYVSMAYIDLATLAVEAKKYDLAKQYLKKVDELAEYVWVKKQASVLRAKMKN